MNFLDNNNYEDNNIRVFNIDDEIWFVRNDMANMLGYKTSKQAIQDNVPKKHQKILTQSNTGFKDLPNRGLMSINEARIY